MIWNDLIGLTKTKSNFFWKNNYNTNVNCFLKISLLNWNKLVKLSSDNFLFPPSLVFVNVRIRENENDYKLDIFVFLKSLTVSFLLFFRPQAYITGVYICVAFNVVSILLLIPAIIIFCIFRSVLRPGNFPANDFTVFWWPCHSFELVLCVVCARRHSFHKTFWPP